MYVSYVCELCFYFAVNNCTCCHSDRLCCW